MIGPRIVSLLPAATEIVCALGLGEQLVGISHECDFPPEVVGKPVLTEARVDSNGSSRAIDEAVRAMTSEGTPLYRVLEDRLAVLAPDVIVTQDTCDVCAVSRAEVEDACRRLRPGVAIVALAPLGLDDVLADIVRVGEATDSAAAAERCVASLHERLDALRTRTAALTRPRVLLLEWLDPPMPPGHWTPELLRIAGGEPVLAHDRAPTCASSWEEIRAADPDVVLVAPCGFDQRRAEEELARVEVIRDLRAVRDGRMHVLDGNAYFNRPGPRLVDSAELAARAMHG